MTAFVNSFGFTVKLNFAYNIHYTNTVCSNKHKDMVETAEVWPV